MRRLRDRRRDAARDGSSDARRDADGDASETEIRERDAAAAPARARRDPGVACPRDLAISAAQRAHLVSQGIPEWVIDAICERVVARYVGDASVTRSVTQWRSTLVTAVVEDWRDPDRRPSPPGGPSGRGVVAAYDDVARPRRWEHEAPHGVEAQGVMKTERLPK
jgi:hypothetical protein